MSPLQSFFRIYLPREVMQRLFTFFLLISLAFLIRDFLVLFFVTFIFAYIFLELGKKIYENIHTWTKGKDHQKINHFVKKYINVNTIVTVLYILFILVLIFALVNLLPRISVEIRDFVRQGSALTHSAQDIVGKIENSLDLKIGLDKMAQELIDSDRIDALGQAAIGHIRNAGTTLLKFLLALLLSYIFILERRQIRDFFARLKNGNFSFLYHEGSLIAKKIGGGFGTVLRAQGVIAFVNAILTTFGLFLIGMFLTGMPFPFTLTLAIIVFIFGFIPFFGVFLSGMPIVLLSYGISGWIGVISVVIMILIIHMIEAYYLNPKIVSSYMHLPVFITFLILLISEHFLGVVGLLIGVPLTNIFLDFMDDLDQYIDAVRKRRSHG